MRRYVSFAVLSVLVLVLFSCGSSVKNQSGNLRVHFLDVGQSDAAFVELGQDMCMLVDSADAEHGERVCRYIKELGYSKIDTLFITHPHSDHSGGAVEIIEKFSIGRILISNTSYSTPEQESALSLAEQRGIEVISVDDGDGFGFGDSDVMFLKKAGDCTDENDESVAMRLSFGDVAFLFMADCGVEAEAEFSELDKELSANIVKVGHHGSGGSSSDEFISEVGADFAVISCSEDNEYAHPSPYTVNRWQMSGAVVMATDECSDIVFTTDGCDISVSCNCEDTHTHALSTSEGKECLWVLDTDSHTVHKEDCRHTDSIAKGSVELSSADIERLYAEGYRKCSFCFIGR